MRMEIQKNLNFGGFDSKSLGLYITGQSAYNAPPRAYEAIAIPGRNGDLSIDGGRWENIEVTYPAGIYTESMEEYRQQIAQIRAEFSHRIGYQRITDDYNPDEFRLGIYTGGLETLPVHYISASEFNLTFNCKPQRFLVEGETPVDVAGGWGENVLTYPYSDTTSTVNGIVFTDNGDGTITANGTATADADFGIKRQNHEPYMTLDGVYMASGCPAGGGTDTYYLTATYGSGQGSTNPQYGRDTGSGFAFTADSTARTGVWIIIKAGVTVNNLTFTPQLQPESSGSGSGSGSITNPTHFESTPLLIVTGTGTLGIGSQSLQITGTTGQVLHIDCDIMEVWEETGGGGKVPRNDQVRFAGKRFPVLAPGENGITWTSDISNVTIIPRWWRL